MKMASNNVWQDREIKFDAPIRYYIVFYNELLSRDLVKRLVSGRAHEA